MAEFTNLPFAAEAIPSEVETNEVITALQKRIDISQNAFFMRPTSHAYIYDPDDFKVTDDTFLDEDIIGPLEDMRNMIVIDQPPYNYNITSHGWWVTSPTDDFRRLTFHTTGGQDSDWTVGLFEYALGGTADGWTKELTDPIHIDHINDFYYLCQAMKILKGQVIYADRHAFDIGDLKSSTSSWDAAKTLGFGDLIEHGASAPSYFLGRSAYGRYNTTTSPPRWQVRGYHCAVSRSVIDTSTMSTTSVDAPVKAWLMISIPAATSIHADDTFSFRVYIDPDGANILVGTYDIDSLPNQHTLASGEIRGWVEVDVNDISFGDETVIEFKYGLNDTDYMSVPAGWSDPGTYSGDTYEQYVTEISAALILQYDFS